MIRHESLDDDLRDRMLEYVLGALDESEAHAVSLHLPQCEVCRDYVEEIGRVSREILLAAPRRAPPPELWERIVEGIGANEASSPISRAIGSQVSGQGTTVSEVLSSPGFSFVGSESTGWTPTGVPGVEVRKLSVDPENDRMTFLARMAPGSSYPSHRHGGPEECFVLEGDLDVGDRRMRAGDFQRAEEGSVHPTESTREGCLLLIVSSLRDEMLG